MNIRTIVLGVGAAATLGLTGVAGASSISYQVSGIGPSGHVAAFDGSGYGAGTTGLQSALDDANANAMGSVFAGAGFSDNLANVFFVDFGAGSDWGVTMFAMWGTDQTDANQFGETQITFNPFVDIVNGGLAGASAGQQEFVTFGSMNATPAGFIGIATDNAPATLPTGFAITNFDFGTGGSIASKMEINFNRLNGVVNGWGLFSANTAGPVLVGGTGPTENTLIVAIPLPAPVWLGLAGLIGVGVLRKRMVA